MGGKKRRIIAYTGSLIQPVFRYLIRAEFNLHLNDRRGSAIAHEMIKEVYTLPRKYLQPNLETKIREDKTGPEASFYFKYMNGWEHTLKLGKTDIPAVKAFMEQYNEIIEMERAEKGHDDEPEDEDRHIKTSWSKL